LGHIIQSGKNKINIYFLFVKNPVYVEFTYKQRGFTIDDILITNDFKM